jgi:glycine cleavage system H protein
MQNTSELRYSTTHEWASLGGTGATVGITDHAAAQLGDVIFVELPEVGRTLTAGERFGVIESVKAASDLYAPVGGTVVEINTQLAGLPELVNSDPFGDGWMVKLSGADEAGVELLSEEQYRVLTR